MTDDTVIVTYARHEMEESKLDPKDEELETDMMDHDEDSEDDKGYHDDDESSEDDKGYHDDDDDKDKEKQFLTPQERAFLAALLS